MYFGGGSPTFLKEKEFELLKKKLGLLLNFKNLNEFSVEIDPRRVDENRLLFLCQPRSQQNIIWYTKDFDLKVQENINRIQPVSIIQKLLSDKVKESFKSINFDLLIGLPGQTKKVSHKLLITK